MKRWFIALCLLTVVAFCSPVNADGYIVRESGWYGNSFELGKGANLNTLTMSGSTITVSGGLTVTGALSAGSAAWPTAISLPATGSTITGTAAEPLNIVRSFTDATAEKGLSLSVTALDTTSGTTAQYAQWINNAASSEALDALTLYDTADADDTVGAIIKVLNTGAGTGYTYLIDTPNLDISYAGAITGCTGITATGGGSLTGTWSDLGTVSTMDLNGGTIDGTTIGGSTPAAIAGTTGVFSSTLTTQGASLTTSGVGSIQAQTGLSLVEQGNSVVHKTIFTLADVSISITDAGGGDEGWGTLQIYNFPDGGISILGAHADVSVDQSAATGGDAGGTIADTGSGDFSIGSVGTANESLGDAGEANIMSSKAMTEPFVSGIGDANGVVACNTSVIDGTGTAADAYLNMIFDAGDVSANSACHLTGTITIIWTNVGDF